MKKIGAFLTGLMIFVGIPVVSWGLYDIIQFLNNPARAGYVILMIISTILVVFLVPSEGRSRGEGKQVQKKHKISLAFLQVVSLAEVIIAPWCDRHLFAILPDSSLIRFTGIILTAFGFGLMNWSVKILDKQFSTDVTLQEQHELITKGPYKLIRHPRYLGILIFMTGISLVFAAWLPLILVAATLMVLLWRIHDEEKLMRQQFSDQWMTYKQSSYALIPFIF